MDDKFLIKMYENKLGKQTSVIYTATKQVYGTRYRKYLKFILHLFEIRQRVLNIRDMDFSQIKELVTIYKKTRDIVVRVYRIYNRGKTEPAIHLFEKYVEYVQELTEKEKGFAFKYYSYKNGLPLFFCRRCNKRILAARLLYGLLGEIDSDLKEEIDVGIIRLAGCVDRGIRFECPACGGQGNMEQGAKLKGKISMISILKRFFQIVSDIHELY